MMDVTHTQIEQKSRDKHLFCILSISYSQCFHKQGSSPHRNAPRTSGLKIVSISIVTGDAIAFSRRPAGTINDGNGADRIVALALILYDRLFTDKHHDSAGLSTFSNDHLACKWSTSGCQYDCHDQRNWHLRRKLVEHLIINT